MTTKVCAPGQGAKAVRMQGSNADAEPLMLRKRIGSTTFLVNVHFSSTGKETLEAKIHRLIEREVDKVA
jgi:hypothetical protein